MSPRPPGSAVERILTPEMQALLYEKAADALSRIIERYLPRNHAPPEPPAPPPPAPAIDPYRALGLRPGCKPAQVKARVRELARIFHPDLPTGNSDKMTEINIAAREILAVLGER